MKIFTLCAILSIFAAHAKYLIEIDQTRPIYLPVEEYNFELKNKTLRPITVTLKNGEHEISQTATPFVVKDRVINLVLRAAGLDLKQQTILIIRYTDKDNKERKQTYQFMHDVGDSLKKILIKWDGYNVLSQDGTMLRRTTSGLPLRGNIEAKGIKLMAKENIQSESLN